MHGGDGICRVEDKTVGSSDALRHTGDLFVARCDSARRARVTSRLPAAVTPTCPYPCRSFSHKHPRPLRSRLSIHSTSRGLRNSKSIQLNIVFWLIRTLQPAEDHRRCLCAGAYRRSSAQDSDFIQCAWFSISRMYYGLIHDSCHICCSMDHRGQGRRRLS